MALPGAGERGETPAAVGLLLGEQFGDDGLLLFGFEETGEFRGSPQENGAIDGGLRGEFAIQVIAQHFEVGLDFGAGTIVFGCGADGDCGQGGSIKVGIVSFPWFVSEAQPQPFAFFVSGSLLLGPHVIESGAGVGAELAGLGAVAGEDQGVEDGFSAAGFDGFVRAAIGVFIKGLDFFPEADALGDIVEEPAFVGGRGGFGEGFAEGWARERVRDGSVAGNTEGFMIARGLGPFHPPGRALIKVRSSSFLIPGIGDFSFRRISMNR